MDYSSWIQPTPAEYVDGFEPFIGTSSTVQDFWRFAMGDLRMNNTRGYLAEFLVAQALGLRDVRRVEWDAYDLLLDDAIRIEVKSSAYLQAWEQRVHSRIQFSGLRGTRYHPRYGDDPAGRQLNAHVYVFCVQTAKEHESYQPLNIGQWEFYVAGKDRLETVGQSVGLPTVMSLTHGPTAWADLRATVVSASVGQCVNDEPWWT